jgi:MFS transporter, FHS family, L-fucose permease
LLLRLAPRNVLTVYGVANVILCLIVSAGIKLVSALSLVVVFFFMGTVFAIILPSA